jgi:D-glycero-alpha-D-manno-heptose 1-phosphate guanylyltransferase
MDAILLVGGLGTRLRSVVSDVPKPLAPIEGRPFLDLLLEQLGRFPSVDRVVLAVGHLADHIVERYAAGSATRPAILFSREATPLGTGGAMRQALERCDSDPVLVMNGDSYFDLDFDGMRRAHESTDALLTVAVTEVPDCGRYGAVSVAPGGTRVLAFREKDGIAAPGLVNAGCYLVSRGALAHFPAGASSFERDVIPRLLGGTFAWVQGGRFIDIGTPETYALAQSVLRPPGGS